MAFSAFYIAHTFLYIFSLHFKEFFSSLYQKASICHNGSFLGWSVFYYIL